MGGAIYICPKCPNLRSSLHRSLALVLALALGVIHVLVPHMSPKDSAGAARVCWAWVPPPEDGDWHHDDHFHAPVLGGVQHVLLAFLFSGGGAPRVQGHRGKGAPWCLGV